MSGITVGRKRRWQLSDYTPNAWALEHVIGRSEHFIIGTTGRQTGKTSGAAELIDNGMCSDPDPLDMTPDVPPFVGVLGPTYDKAEICVNTYINMLAKTFGVDSYRLNLNKHELTIRDPLAGKIGARLKWLSAEDPYNVVGYTFSHFIVDEAQAVPDDVWIKFLPSQGVRNAHGYIFGTPDNTQDQTWFEGLYERGQDPLDQAYYSFTVATWDAPWMPIEMIMEYKKQMAADDFDRLLGGKWVARQGLVFTGLQDVIVPVVPEYRSDRKYIAAMDFAVSEDFNVFMVGDPATNTVIYRERWNKSDPLVTYDRFEGLWERFGKPRIYADQSAMGGLAFVSELRRRGMQITGTTFTQYNKVDLIQALASDIQHRRIMFPDWDDLMREFRVFVYKRTPMGKLTASAKPGAHDDLVMTLVLLNAGFRARSNSELVQANYLTGAPRGRIEIPSFEVGVT